MHHHFKATKYYTTIGSHEPVLHIASGDSVSTTTVDAAGCDATGEPITERGNPMTGPFYVEGAEPGDTLKVRLMKLSPNRERGYSGKMLAPNVVDPEYVPDLPWPIKDEARWAQWQVDIDANKATLTGPEALKKGLELPLEPMLGCFGVAPPREQAISTATSAEHGGNMDYRGFREGVTVHLPVFTEGALFHLGDGHALQGDGEMAGTGIEISMDVTFEIELIKGKQINWPRGENDDFIFTVGNARPLDQAAQHATTEMLRWLIDDFDLDARTANILMGQAVRYELGNMFDPAYTFVCKMPKRVGNVELTPRAQ